MLLLFFGGLVISAQNSVHSIFFLVLVFLTSVFLLFFLEVEFVSLLFLLVYVGAIAVLFLFVVMMLDIKVTKPEKKFFILLPIGVLINVAFLIVVWWKFRENLVFLYPSRDVYINWFSLVDPLSNIEVLGQLLYTSYFFYFLIAGIILLVAMIGAIVLTLGYTQKAKHQFVFRQILREKKNSIFLIQK